MAREESAKVSRGLIGALALALALGSLHAFSVLVAPLERQVGTDRAAISLVYSLAIVSLTAGVLVSDAIVRRLRSALIAAGVAAVAVAGLLIAATTQSYWLLMLGFGLMFGAANGVGYSLFLRRSSAALPSRPGTAVGIATAGYAMGAMVFAWALASERAGPTATRALLWIAIGVGVSGVVAHWAFQRDETPAGVASALAPAAGTAGSPMRLILDLWLIYLLGATGGLMAIAHAAGIVVALGGSGAASAMSATALALGNLSGSLAGGWLADRLSPYSCLAGAIALGALASVALASASGPGQAVMVLSVAGVAYGALIALVPVVIDRQVAASERSFVFSRVFTAWGAAGLAGPWIAGLVYDHTGGYTVALIVAAALSSLGAVLTLVRLRTSRGH